MDSANSGMESAQHPEEEKDKPNDNRPEDAEMDGLALIREARKLKTKTKFIMMTAYGEIETYLDAISTP